MNEIRLNMTRTEYDALDRVNFSTLKAMDRSPAHYAAGVDEERDDTDALLIGRAVDTAVLEPRTFAESFVVWDGDKRGNAWKDFAATHSSIDILKRSQMEEVQAIANAVRSDKHAAKYLGAGKAQPSLLWTQAVTDNVALEMKGRLDFIADCGALVDLKTTKDASPEGFGKAAWNYRYFVQAALYSDAFYAITGRRLPFVFIAVEKTFPYVVQVYRVPEDVLIAGRNRYDLWLSRLAWCRQFERWPAYADGETDLELPRFAMQQIGEALNAEQQEGAA